MSQNIYFSKYTFLKIYVFIDGNNDSTKCFNEKDKDIKLKLIFFSGYI